MAPQITYVGVLIHGTAKYDHEHRTETGQSHRSSSLNEVISMDVDWAILQLLFSHFVDGLSLDFLATIKVWADDTNGSFLIYSLVIYLFCLHLSSVYLLSSSLSSHWSISMEYSDGNNYNDSTIDYCVPITVVIFSCIITL